MQGADIHERKKKLLRKAFLGHASDLTRPKKRAACKIVLVLEYSAVLLRALERDTMNKCSAHRMRLLCPRLSHRMDAAVKHHDSQQGRKVSRSPYSRAPKAGTLYSEARGSG